MPAQFIPRILAADIKRSLAHNPVTAVLGPRQCGKSTLVKEMLNEFQGAIYLDLERPSDLQKLEDPEWFLSAQSGKLVCMDEIQRKPEIFPILRSLVDETGQNGLYLILGSASRDLLRQSSETLAGRISYRYLTPFLWDEVSGEVTIEEYIAKGGFPRSLLTNDEKVSFEWRQSFISTFLERDLLQFGGFTPALMRRLWQMLAHTNGQTVNYSNFGSSLGISHTTVRNYIDLLEGTFMVKQVQPYRSNTAKRLVKSPKVYITDSGIAAALLQLRDFSQIAGHPIFGSLWEGAVLANIIGQCPELDITFYRTSHGTEIDFVVTYGSTVLVIECKASVSPSLTVGNYNVIEDIQPDEVCLVAPVEMGYPMKPGTNVYTLDEIVQRLKRLIE